ncbi:MAG TPA: hypothetical protein VHB48_06845 [Chitinophagaceae bacterium]|nr:hypothetical protein [Chitinophagaceae bacterium]
MTTHFSNDAERAIALKRARFMISSILLIVVLLMAFCAWKIIYP